MTAVGAGATKDRRFLIDFLRKMRAHWGQARGAALRQAFVDACERVEGQSPLPIQLLFRRLLVMAQSVSLVDTLDAIDSYERKLDQLTPRELHQIANQMHKLSEKCHQQARCERDFASHELSALGSVLTVSGLYLKTLAMDDDDSEFVQRAYREIVTDCREWVATEAVTIALA